jgi:hypothetical protein
MSPIVSIFGSSRPLPDSEEYRVAFDTGRALAEAGFTICNGGYAGTMEAAARGAREAGGHTIGVTAGVFTRKVNPWIREEIKTDTMVERLLKLIELGQAYVVLRGGTGTLLELAAVWEFVNKGMMPKKPIIILGNFWNSVVGSLKNELVWEGLGECTSYVKQAATPTECVQELKGAFSR